MGWWKVVVIGRDALRRVVLCLAGLAAMFQLGPVLSMTASMLLSVFIYALAFGWKFAFGFVILLLVHELGHIIASRVVGIRTSVLLFIPFIGAVIRLAAPPANIKMEANIALGGPALGTISALVCLAFFFWTDSLLLLALSYTACLINLFNLIPCAPFDGGRIGTAISPYMWRVGSMILGLLLFYTKNLVIFLVFAFSLMRWWRGDDVVDDERYYRLSLYQRFSVAWQYFGLIGVLGISTLYLSHLLR